MKTSQLCAPLADVKSLILCGCLTMYVNLPISAGPDHRSTGHAGFQARGGPQVYRFITNIWNNTRSTLPWIYISNRLIWCVMKWHLNGCNILTLNCEAERFFRWVQQISLFPEARDLQYRIENDMFMYSLIPKGQMLFVCVGVDSFYINCENHKFS